MKISVMVYSFASLLSRGTMTIASAIEYVSELGIDAVELMDGFIDEDDLTSIEAALAKSGARVVCYDVSGDFAATAADGWPATIAGVRRGFERASRLGAPHVLLVPGSPPAGMSPDVARASYAAGIRDCLPDARRLGLTVSIENLGGQALVCGTSEQLLAICDAVGPELKVTFDAGNFLLAGEDPLEALARLRPRIVYVHLKDWRVVPTKPSPGQGEYLGLDGRSFTGAALGDGVVNLRAVIGRLRESGYGGYVSVEYEGSEEPREAVKRGVGYLSPGLSPRRGEV